MGRLAGLLACAVVAAACGDDGTSGVGGGDGQGGGGGGATTSGSSAAGATTSGSSTTSATTVGSTTSTGASMGDAETPPEGADAVDAWLAAGHYRDWACEEAVHEARSPSPHGFNRICSNALIAADATGTADWPVGAAAVKELYDAPDAPSPTGFAVYRKTQPDSASGAGWYWYERIGASVIADGPGDAGPAGSICASCHQAAGADDAHTPSPGARDFVYTPVP